MPTIAEVRQQYPQYSDMPDTQLADALHSKFYSDMPREQFNAKIGLASQPQGDNVGGPVEETARAFNNGLDAFRAAGPQNVDPKNYSSVGQLLKTGRAIAAIPEMAASIFTGPATSAVGNTLEGIDKLIPVTDVQRAQYGLDTPREGAAKAIMGAAPRGVSPMGVRPAPAPPPAAPLTEGQQVAEAGERLGVTLPRAVTSDRTSVQQIGKIATNIPLGGTPLRKASQAAIGQLDDAALATQQGYGSGSAGAAGRAAEDGITDWIKVKSKDKVSAQYDKVDALVDPNALSPLTRTTLEAQKILARRERAGISQPSEAVKKIADAASRTGMEYEGIKDLRTYIRETLDNGPLPADISGGELKTIYGALTNDLRDSIRAAGGDKAVGAWEKANRYTAATAQRRENLARIIGAKSDEQVFSRIASAAASGTKGDIQLLHQARRSVDNGTWDEISSAVISSLGRAPSGEFTPDRFVTSWGKLSPQAKSLLFKSTGKPELASALDDIAKVSTRFKQLQQFANPSGTGQTTIGAALGGGVLIDPVTAATSVMSARIISEVLARPAAATSFARWAKAYEMAVRAPIRSSAALQAFNGATRALAEEVGRLANAPQHVGELMRQLQGVVPVRSDDQQPQ